jgi:uncharacterized protein
MNTSLTKLEPRRLASCLSNRRLELIVMPTEQCNFRCTYCYEDFKLGRMSSDTIAGLRALISNRIDKLDQLYISWFGGEPLAAADIMLDLSSHASRLAAQRPKINYRAGITTNGYLLNQHLLDQMASVRILDFQITLDGPKEIHDRRRLRADGSGSYEKIWNNLLLLKATPHPFKILLRIHFDRDTVACLDPLIQDVKRDLITDPRFEVCFKGLLRMGGPNDDRLNVFSESEANEQRESLMRKLYGDHVPVEEPFICYAAKPNALVIRSDGTLAKCTVALNDPRNKVGVIHRDGTVEVDMSRYRPWLTGLAKLDLDILACPLQYVRKTVSTMGSAATPIAALRVV